MNKKAFFFTLTVLFLITLLLLISFSYKKEYTKESIKIRLQAGNAFVEAIEKDAERAINLVSRRALIALNDYVATRGVIPEDKNFDEIFAEAILNGTLNNTLGYTGAERLLKNYTLEDWKNETKKLLSISNFELVFYDVASEIHVNQTSPWAIDINFTLKYLLRDKEINAFWNRSINVVAKVPIFGLEDPLYLREFGRENTNLIHMSPYSGFVDDSCDATNLTLHITSTNTTGSFYINGSGPSYLSRLKGKFNVDDGEIGIESIINPNKISLLNRKLSLVDHSYASNVIANVSIVNAGWIIMNEEDTLIYKIPKECRVPFNK